MDATLVDSSDRSSKQLMLLCKLKLDLMHSRLKHEIKDCQSFVELGCGAKSPAVEYIKDVFSVGVDGDLPSLLLNKKSGYFKDYILADLNHLPLKDDSFDCVAAFDVIEHLTKSQGMVQIDNMERISKKRIIILTPNGFNPKCHLEDDNPMQIHRSGWTADEFLNRGYAVFGIDGVQRLRGEQATATIKPRILGSLLSRLSDPLVFRHPSAAFALLCIKKKSNSKFP